MSNIKFNFIEDMENFRSYNPCLEELKREHINLCKSIVQAKSPVRTEQILHEIQINRIRTYKHISAITMAAIGSFIGICIAHQAYMSQCNNYNQSEYDHLIISEPYVITKPMPLNALMFKHFHIGAFIGFTIGPRLGALIAFFVNACERVYYWSIS